MQTEHQRLIDLILITKRSGADTSDFKSESIAECTPNVGDSKGEGESTMQPNKKIKLNVIETTSAPSPLPPPAATATVAPLINDCNVINNDISNGNKNNSNTRDSCSTKNNSNDKNISNSKSNSKSMSKNTNSSMSSGRSRTVVVADMMAGVGPFAVPIAMQSRTKVFANGIFKAS